MSKLGRYSVYVNNYSHSHDVPFELIVLGGGEDQYGRVMVKSWKDLMSPASGPRIKVCEFEFHSKTERLEWLYPPSTVQEAEAEGSFSSRRKSS